MPVQDLTPQLRTRLSRVERVVGLFVVVATLLLLSGFAYYIYHTGRTKGWWVEKYRYYTFVDSGAGLNPGGDVRLLGFKAGEITKIEAMEPFFAFGAVYVEFDVYHPYQGYIWTDSKVRVIAAGFVGDRLLEVIPGGKSGETNLHATYQIDNLGTKSVWDDKKGGYVALSKDVKGYWLPALEAPPVTERLEQIANQAQAALPGILDLTNRVNEVLSNVAGLTSEAKSLLANAGPMLSNVTTITANIKDPKGSLGEWILPTNLNTQLTTTLGSANIAITNATRFLANTDSNVTMLATNLDVTISNLGNITSNLNAQVQANTNLVKEISDTIVSANQMLQGLQKHWFLRSAFKKKVEEAAKEETGKTNAPVSRPPVRAGKWRD
jgi:ABC-type transporter Mla subunit MlaD